MKHLDKVRSPADLRGLSRAELAGYCADVRQFVVESVARTGGHLGSNLGAVELTVALHRVFESPRDVIVFDTGHQAYVHKLITGRADDFGSLRQFGGLSGYPSRAESEHDWVENSHASTALSWASGLAAGFELRGLSHRRVVAVVGDGSLTGGMAFEALNNLGHYRQRVVIVLNDNGRSYAPTVSHISNLVSRIRQSPHWVQSKEAVEKLLERVPMGKELRRGLDSAAAALREMWEPPAFFETLGVRYVGPVDGHDIGSVEQALRDAAAYELGPIVVHVTTQKGRGYAPAEQDDEKHLHDTPSFDLETGPKQAAPQPVEQPLGSPNASVAVSEQAPPATYTDVFSRTLIDVARTDDRIVAITAAMGGSTGLVPFQQRWPERFFDVGIAEQHALTAAAGLARAGMRPVVAVYSTFLTRALDQVLFDVGLHGADVILCLDRAGITGPDGPSHHGLYDVALLSRVPGLTLLAPSSANELDAMLRWAVADGKGPIAIRWPRGAAHPSEIAGDTVGATEAGEGLAARQVIAPSADAGPVDVGAGGRGDARCTPANHQVCLLAAGSTLAAATDAAAMLADEHVDVSLWDARSLRPLCPTMLADAGAHPLVVTVEDGVASGGFGSAVTEALQRSAARSVPRVVALGVPDEFIAHGSPAELAAEMGLDALGIKLAVRKMFAQLG